MPFNSTGCRQSSSSILTSTLQNSTNSLVAHQHLGHMMRRISPFIIGNRKSALRQSHREPYVFFRVNNRCRAQSNCSGFGKYRARKLQLDKQTSSSTKSFGPESCGLCTTPARMRGLALGLGGRQFPEKKFAVGMKMGVEWVFSCQWAWNTVSLECEHLLHITHDAVSSDKDASKEWDKGQLIFNGVRYKIDT
jgi:hypothetical protein